MKTQEAGSQVLYWELCGSVTWNKSLPLPGPQFSLLCYGVLKREILRILPALPAGSELGCLNQGSASVGAPGLGTENGEEIENPPNTHSPPGSARPTHTSMLELKARFTLALIFTTCPTLGEKSRR